MRQPAAAPLDHFCILFLREKDVPARHERRSHPAAAGGYRAGGQCPLPPPAGGGYRVYVSIATQLRASRTMSPTKLRARLPAPVGAHLPVGEVALAGSARCQIALWCNG